MKRWSIVLLIVSLVSVLAMPEVVAGVGPTVGITLDKAGAVPGDTVTLTVTVNGATDLYGSSVDIYYDPTKLVPSVPADMQAAASAWLVAAGATIPTGETAGYFASAPAASGTPSRQSLVVLRVGSQSAAAGTGTIGSMVFTVLGSQASATSTTTFSVMPPPATSAVGDVGVQLANSAGSNIAFTPDPAHSSASLTIGETHTLAIVEPAVDTTALSHDFAVSGTGTAFANVTVALDASHSQTVTVGGSGLWTALFTGIPEGQYTATATAGSEAAFRTFYVDLSGPTITIDEIVTGTNLLVSGTVADPNLDPTKVAVYRGTGQPTQGDYVELTGTDPITFQRSFVGLEPGTYTFTVWAMDRAGHSTTQTMQGTVVPVLLGSISGHVALLERSPFGTAPVNHSGTMVTVVGLGIHTLTDSDGNFTFPTASIPVGTYTLNITRPSYLSVVVSGVPVSSDQTTSLADRTFNSDSAATPIGMVPGNIVDNSTSYDTVYLEDLAAMARAFNTTGTPINNYTLTSFTPAYNSKADLNGDGAIDIGDLGILGGHWAQGGPFQESTAPVASTVLHYVAPQ